MHLKKNSVPYITQWNWGFIFSGLAFVSYNSLSRWHFGLFFTVDLQSTRLTTYFRSGNWLGHFNRWIFFNFQFTVWLCVDSMFRIIVLLKHWLCFILMQMILRFMGCTSKNLNNWSLAADLTLLVQLNGGGSIVLKSND